MIRLGGFHIALNYLALIGKMFQESGLEDVFIESGLYGSSSTMALLWLYYATHHVSTVTDNTYK